MYNPTAEQARAEWHGADMPKRAQWIAAQSRKVRTNDAAFNRATVACACLTALAVFLIALVA